MARNRIVGRRVVLGATITMAGAAMALAATARSQPAGYALRFHGHGTGGIDRVEIPLDAPARPVDVGATDFTVEWWMKAEPGDNAATGGQCGVKDGWILGNILLDRDVFGDGDHGDWGVSLSGGRVVFGVSVGAEGTTICSTRPVDDGAWHHVAASRQANNGRLQLVVDGQLQGQAMGPPGDASYRDGRDTTHPSDPLLVLGAEKHDAGTEYPSYRGLIDELRLSTRVRYSGPFNPSTVPLTPDAATAALYHFDEGPEGACTGTVNDSATVAGGPSPGRCQYGGDTPGGPEYVADEPWTGPATATRTRTGPTPTPHAGTPGPDPTSVALRFEPVAGGLAMVTGLAFPPDGSERMFVLEKEGRVRIVKEGTVLPEPFLDLRAQVSTEVERGLLGIAFHPNFSENRTVFLGYTALDGALTYARYRTGDDVDRADPNSAEVVLTFPHARAYHNAGHLAFAPDGTLFIATGDNGDGQNAQRPDVWHGKVLRLDVDGAPPYEVPPDNPFVGDPNTLPELWSLGLRNPWRFSFDRATGDLYIADVGAAQREEVNFEPSGSSGGANYGWPRMEGSVCTPGFDCADWTAPVLEYDHDSGCSITGGFVYRGTRYPALAGAYLYADWCERSVWAASRDGSGQWRTAIVGEVPMNPTTFGEDEFGELYLGGGNQVVMLQVAGAPAQPSPADPSPSPSPTPRPTPQPTHASPAWLPVALNGPGRPPAGANPLPTRSRSPIASPSPTGTAGPGPTHTPEATRTPHPATPTSSPTATVSPTPAGVEQCRNVIPDGSFEFCGLPCNRASPWHLGNSHGGSTGRGWIVDRNTVLHEARSGRWMAQIRPGVPSTVTLAVREELHSPTFEGEWPRLTRAVLRYAIDVHSQELLRADKLSVRIVHGDEWHIVASYDQDALADGWTDDVFDVTAAFRNSAATDPGGPSQGRPMNLIFAAVDDGGEFSEPTWWHIDSVVLNVCTRR